MAGTAPVRVLRFIVIYELTSTAEWFWSGASQPRYGATATLGWRLEGDRVIIGFGGWGIKEEDIPRSPERIKDFHRHLSVAPRGTPAIASSSMCFLLMVDGRTASSRPITSVSTPLVLLSDFLH